MLQISIAQEIDLIVLIWKRLCSTKRTAAAQRRKDAPGLSVDAQSTSFPCAIYDVTSCAANLSSVATR